MREIAETATVPLVISGGFTPANLTDEWSVLIVGGAVVNARQPGIVVQTLRQTLDQAV